MLESFILREGTDYGAQELTMETKLERLTKQLDKGDVKIVFDPNSQSVTLMTKRDWQKISSNKSSSL